MRLSIPLLAPLLGLHVVICLVHFRIRPMLEQWHQTKQPTVQTSLANVEFLPKPFQQLPSR
jgi:hypothetical protein